MRVDLHKFIIHLLPGILRKKVLIAFIHSLLSECQKALNRFVLFSLDASYRSNANASIMSLEHHIRREFDVLAKITNLSGKPVDFLVTIDGYVDESRLRAFIDRYKLFGKSYTLQINGIAYVSEFVDHVCENLNMEYVSEFVNHVCESKPVVTISFSRVLHKADDIHIHVFASSEVYTDVSITMRANYWGNKISEGRNVIMGGSNETHIVIPRNGISTPLLGLEMYVWPSEDKKYHYRRNNT